jgi:hypothetical protein
MEKVIAIHPIVFLLVRLHQLSQQLMKPLLRRVPHEALACADLCGIHPTYHQLPHLLLDFVRWTIFRSCNTFRMEFHRRKQFRRAVNAKRSFFVHLNQFVQSPAMRNPMRSHNVISFLMTQGHCGKKKKRSFLVQDSVTLRAFRFRSQQKGSKSIPLYID